MPDTPALTPALTPEEWARLGNGRGDFFGGGNEAVLRWSIAINNAALPDDSPYKITRADVEMLRWAAPHAGESNASAEDQLLALAAQLELLLPPETP